MNGVKPYIAFSGNCEEAIGFYKDALGGELLYMQRYGESPMKGMGPDDQVMHCTLKIGDTHILACDRSSSGDPVSAGSNISLAMAANEPAAADRMFERLSEGGIVTMPIQETYWAERFGMLTDKFGVSWMINCDKADTDHAKATA